MPLIIDNSEYFFTGGGAPVTPSWLPSGAFAYVDFNDTSHCWLNGALSTPGAIFSGYSSGDLVTDKGLSADSGATSRLKASAALKAEIVARLGASGGGLTAVFETHGTTYPYLGGDANYGPNMQIMDGTDPNVATNFIYVDQYSSNYPWVGDKKAGTYNVDFPSDLGGTGYAVQAGVQKTGATLYRPLGGGAWESSSSLNGEVDTTTVPNDASWMSIVDVDIFQVATSWNYYLTNARASRIWFMEALNPTDLQAQTAPEFPMWVDWDAGTHTGTVHNISVPTHDIGDLLVVLFGSPNNPTLSITGGTGWTASGPYANGTNPILEVYSKVATATNDSLQITTSVSKEIAFVTMIIKNAATLEVGSSNTGATQDMTTPSMSPAAGEANYLFLSVISQYGTVSNNPVYPNGDLVLYSYGSITGDMVAVGAEWAHATSYTPKAWDTMDDEPWVGLTLAISA